MTTLEMQQYFETLLQTTSPAYNDSDKPDTDTILRYLNTAQTKYIKDKYLSLPTFRERCKVLSENVKDFGTLVTHNLLDLSLVATFNVPNSKLFALTGDEWHIIKAGGEITRTTIEGITVPTYMDFAPFNLNNLDWYTTNYINIPVILVPVFSQLTNTTGGNGSVSNLVVMYDNYTSLMPAGSDNVDKLNIIYLKEPNEITFSVNCQLADYLHEEIVKLALQMFEEAKYKLAGKGSK